MLCVTAPERTDADLLAAVAAGDRHALEALYHRHSRWLLLRLQSRCNDDDLVDTALQDTFISAWRSARQFRPEKGEVGAWLWSIALRRLIDQLRRHPHPTPVATMPEPEPLPAPGTRTYDLLSRLPADLHAVVSAVYIDELTTAEAAALLGIPQGTVKSRLSRARDLLQKVTK
ncbi:MAG: RNA polymerase sigma factor [Actinomycetia bacterium]|nr:RNA polymerase sigma factor [Actinomycetes bacterium]